MQGNFGLKLAVGILAVLIIGTIAWKSTAYTVDERQMAVVMLFGKPVAERKDPGLYFTTPIHEVRRVRGTLQFWGGTSAEKLPDIPTKGGKKIEVIPWAIWRISEPTEFVQRLKTEANAERRVHEYVRSAMRNVLAEYELAEIVRSTSRDFSKSQFEEKLLEADEVDVEQPKPNEEVKKEIEFGRNKILDQIRDAAEAELAKAGKRGGRGIELVDVGIAKIEFVRHVQEQAFQRQIAYMTSVAENYRANGERMKQEILNKTKKEVEEIEAAGEKIARTKRGEAEAEVIRDYAKAIEEVGEFYTFVRTLEAYENSLDSNTRIIMTTGSEFLKLLKEVQQGKPNVATQPVSE